MKKRVVKQDYKERMMKSGKACLALAVGLCGALLAKVEPSALFSDHAVLHRSAETPVFGFADVGEKVSVSLGTAQAGGVAESVPSFSMTRQP